MSGFIPDASVALAWCFEDERTAFTEALLSRLRAQEKAFVPSHWPVEILNGLIQAKKRARIDENQIVRFFRSMSSFNVLIDADQSHSRWERVRTLAESYGLTAYDSAYLELAQRIDLPLATLDRDLRRAAQLASVTLIEAS